MMIPAYIKYLYSGLLTVVISGIVFPLSQNRQPELAFRITYWRQLTPLASFFYVVAQAQPFSGLWCLCLHHGSIEIMVVRAGQPSGWPVSNKAGYANPVRAATSEIGVSGGSNNRYLLEAAIMATILTPSHPQYVFVFAAIRRADTHPRICMLRTVSCDERSARRLLVRDYVLSLSARLPAGEVTL